MKIAEFRKLKGSARRSKFGNVKTAYSGRVYHSNRESQRAVELDLMKRAGLLKSWEPQVALPIVVNGRKICTYISDFKVILANGQVEYEDVKGYRTDIYRLKKKLVKAVHDIDIKEI